MRQFFKFMFASLLGTILAFFLATFFGVLLIGALIGSMSALSNMEDSPDVDPDSILHMKLDRPIVDRGAERHFKVEIDGFSTQSKLGLDQILETLEKAAKDERIEGIYLDLANIPTGLSTISEIRKGLLEFKNSGKFIVCYGETLSQSAYYLATVANKIHLYPEGQLDIRGFYAELMFFKGLLEKLDIDVQIVRGENNQFKSAVEPLMYDQMSEANREQTRQYLDGLWGHVLQGIEEQRGIASDKVNRVADSLLLRNAQDAVTYGFIDGVQYKDEWLTSLKDKVDAEKVEDISFLPFTKYIKADLPSRKKMAGKKKKRKKESEEAPRDTSKADTEQAALLQASAKEDSISVTSSGPSEKKKEEEGKVAVVYASGGIKGGKSGDGSMGAQTISKALREARKDASIKAIVLRVNSPGGSALASDVIWREVALAKEAKPLVVSMGDVAASGGYYISCAADRIFANKTTLTGSIGVFGVLPNMKDFFDKNLGVTFDRVETNAHSSIGSMGRPLSDHEYNVIQDQVEDIYNTFLERVAEGRGMSKTRVDSIGQGRVWAGTDALKLGLVDEFGGLQAATDHAAKLADLEDPEIEKLPEQEDPFKQLIEQLTGGIRTSIAQWAMTTEEEQMLEQYRQIRSLGEMKGVQARLPYVVKVK